MSKIQVPTTRHKCDVPGCENIESYGITCLGCGKDFCYDHYEKFTVAYSEGTDLGNQSYYCLGCIERFARESNPLFNAFLRVKDLQEVRTCFLERWRADGKAATDELQRLLGKERP